MSRLKYWRKMYSRRASSVLKAHAKRMYSRYGGRYSTAKASYLLRKGYLR